MPIACLRFCFNKDTNTHTSQVWCVDLKIITLLTKTLGVGFMYSHIIPNTWTSQTQTLLKCYLFHYLWLIYDIRSWMFYCWYYLRLINYQAISYLVVWVYFIYPFRIKYIFILIIKMELLIMLYVDNLLVICKYVIIINWWCPTLHVRICE